MRATVPAFAAFLAVSSCGADADAPPAGNPAQFHQELRGRTYVPDAMALPGGRFLWAQSVLARYRPVGDTPPKVETLPQAGCALPKPSAEAVVRHVHLERGVQQAPLYQFSSADVGNRAKAFVESYVASNGRIGEGGGYEDGDVVRVVNVVVTEKSAPVFLVLSAETNILWNLAPADGVRIENVVVVGIDDVGVANAPDGVAISAIAGAGARRCGAWPMRRPKDDWSFVRNVKASGHASMKETLARSAALGAAYSHWLTGAFGPAAESEAIVLQGASNALVGPPPSSAAARVAFRPIAAGVVRMTANDYRVVADGKGYRAAHRDILVAEATRASGGDLGALLAKR